MRYTGRPVNLSFNVILLNANENREISISVDPNNIEEIYQVMDIIADTFKFPKMLRPYTGDWEPQWTILPTENAHEPGANYEPF